ncbi:MAG: hypothetical protein V1792_29535 [Pseudomonadota bacterium]
MTSEEVQKQVAAWRAGNRANLVDCPLSSTMSLRACLKRRERLGRIQHLRQRSAGDAWNSSDACAACETLFDHDD